MPHRRALLLLMFLATISAHAASLAWQTPASPDTITLRAARLLDGRGGSRSTGDSVRDITALRGVAFVVKDGVVQKKQATRCETRRASC